MKQCFRLISFTLLLSVILTACGTRQSVVSNPTLPVLQTDSIESSKYALSFVFKGNITAGTLITKKMDREEIRIFALTLFGMSLFDFGLKEKEMVVYSCIEPLRQKKVLKILENDFRLLFTEDRRIKKMKEKENRLTFAANRFFLRTLVTASPADRINAVEIKHPWIGLTINLNRINNEHSK